MDAFKIMYSLEQLMLPEWFFNKKGALVRMLLCEETFLYDVTDRLFKENGERNPYSPDQFAVEPFSLSDDVKGLKLVFPTPERTPLCYRIYLFFDRSFEKTSFFCVEKSMGSSAFLFSFAKQNDGSGAEADDAFLCGRTENGSHCNYGRCSLAGQSDFEKCREIYIDQYGLSAK